MIDSHQRVEEGAFPTGLGKQRVRLSRDSKGENLKKKKGRKRERSREGEKEGEVRIQRREVFNASFGITKMERGGKKR